MSGRIYFLRYLATPQPGSRHFLEFGGAYVNCWIRAESEEAAQRRAIAFIREEGWLIEMLEDSYRCSRDDFSDEPAIACFREAEAEGASFSVHTWPPEPQDDDVVN